MVEDERASVKPGLDTGSLAVKRLEHMILHAGEPTERYGRRRKKSRALSPDPCQMEAGGGWAPTPLNPRGAQIASWQAWEGGGEKCWKGQDKLEICL